MTEIAYLRSGHYRVVQTNDGFEVQAERDGLWHKLYRRDDRAKAIKLLESYAS